MVAEAAGQPIGQALQQLRVERRARLQHGAFGIEHGGPRGGALGQGGEQGRLELRLGEHADRPQGQQLAPDRLQPPGARRHFGADRDRRQRLQPEPGLEIVVGVVEHDIGPPADRLQLGGEAGLQGGKVGAGLGGIGGIVRCMLGVGGAQLLRDRGDHGGAVGWIQPQMLVDRRMVMGGWFGGASRRCRIGPQQARRPARQLDQPRQLA